MSEKMATRQAYGEALVELGRINSDIEVTMMETMGPEG